MGKEIQSSISLDLELGPRAFCWIWVSNHVCGSGQVWVQAVENGARTQPICNPNLAPFKIKCLQRGGRELSTSVGWVCLFIFNFFPSFVNEI